LSWRERWCTHATLAVCSGQAGRWRRQSVNLPVCSRYSSLWRAHWRLLPRAITHAFVLTASQGPPVVLYDAVNQTDKEYEQFTVTAFVFKADGTPRARQTAPGRRTLEAHETKYSTIVLDGSPVEPTDLIVIGVDQAQLAGSEQWWHADLRPLAEAAVPVKK
jgi:hypothetical protein